MKQEREDIEEEYEKRYHFFCFKFSFDWNIFLQNLHINFSDVIVGTTRGGAHQEVQNEKNILYLFTLCIHIIFFIWINDEFFPFFCFYFLTYIKTKLYSGFLDKI